MLRIFRDDGVGIRDMREFVFPALCRDLMNSLFSLIRCKRPVIPLSL